MGPRRQWAPRQWTEGDWTCSKCGAKITRLPFNPDPNRLGSLLCKDCHQAQKRGER